LDLELGTIPHDDGADNFIEEETFLWICKFISKSLRLDNLFLRVIVWDYDLEDVGSGSWEAGYLSAVRSIPVSIYFAVILLIQTEKYDDDYSTQQALWLSTLSADASTMQFRAVWQCKSLQQLSLIFIPYLQNFITTFLTSYG
jgi:hypothetical protein